MLAGSNYLLTPTVGSSMACVVDDLKTLKDLRE
jgi:hypothetical protein